jgi:elongation factor 1-gamma
MDGFKRAYSNTDNLKPVLEEFWKNINTNSFSFWWMEYDKAEGECEDLLKTENMIDMFVQKADRMRRYAFGSHVIIGDEPKLYVRGVWMWYG